jgi:hypothetical protein
MRFTVPQFIEHEPKIVGPLTFKQFIFVGSAAALCFAIYFLVEFYIFIIACIILGGIALSFAFLKVGGRPLSTHLGNFFKFTLAPKIYIWKKKDTPVMVFEKEEVKIKKEEIKEDELPLKIAEGSQLKKIKTQVETQTK